MKKMDTSSWIALSGLIVTVVVAIFVYRQNIDIEFIKSNLNKENLQYKISNDIFIDFAKIYNSNYVFLNKLAGKYGTSTDEMLKVATPEEKDRFNQINADFNVVLAQLYISAPDESYKIMIEKWVNDIHTYKDIGENLLVIMRQMNYPDSKYLMRENLKLFEYN